MPKYLAVPSGIVTIAFVAAVIFAAPRVRRQDFGIIVFCWLRRPTAHPSCGLWMVTARPLGSGHRKDG
jgi:hypothetical protein